MSKSTNPIDDVEPLWTPNTTAKFFKRSPRTLEAWRLKGGGDWICKRCHRPQLPPEAIETATVVAEGVQR